MGGKGVCATDATADLISNCQNDIADLILAPTLQKLVKLLCKYFPQRKQHYKQFVTYNYKYEHHIANWYTSTCRDEAVKLNFIWLSYGADLLSAHATFLPYLWHAWNLQLSLVLE